MAERASSGAMKTIYLVTVASMIGASLPYFWKMFRHNSNTVMTVNGVDITALEYVHAVHKERVLLAAMQDRFGAYYEQMLKFMGKSENVEANVLEQLIIQKLLIWYSKRMGIVLSPEFVGHELRLTRILYSVLGEIIPGNIVTEQGIIDYDALPLFLQRQGLTMTQFEAMLDDHLLIAESIRLIRGAHVVSESERKLLLIPRTSTRSFSAELIPLEPFMKQEQKKSIDEAALQGYFDRKNRMERSYWSPERRSGTVLTFNGDTFLKREEANIAQSELKESREKIFEKAFRLEADQVLFGKNEDNVRRFIEDNLGKKSHLAKLTQEKGSSDPLVAVLFELEKPGTRIAFVKGMKGYIIQLDEIHQPEERSFEFVKERVIADYQRDQAIKALKDAIRDHTIIETVKKTFEMKPDTHQMPPDVAQFGVTASGIKRLVAVGQELTGFGAQGEYRIRLEKVSEPSQEFIAKLGGKAALDRMLDQSSMDLIVRQLVASLRNHAILSDVQLKAS